RAGRRAALSLVIALMTLSSAMMAFTPGYATIGIAAPIVVVLARLLQGLSAGGEFGSATSMLIEYAPPDRRGFYGSWQNFGQFVAAVTAALMGALVTRGLSNDALNAWGWRIPFMFGLLIGPVGFYIRTRLHEPPGFEHKDDAHESGRAPAWANAKRASTLAIVWREHQAALWIAFGLVV
ncbi:MFS transporter, partial [Bacillus thuringiensis]